MTTELVPVAPSTGVSLYKASTDAAGMCKEIVVASSQTIQGRRYVKCEGWQAIAIAHGCVASARDVEKIDGGFRAIGEVRRMSDGNVIATAEGFVGDDEKMWNGRPVFARRAMAQTRAISRACRSAFAHVVVMMNAGLSTTPAEEMDGMGEPAPAKPKGKPALEQFESAPAPEPAAPKITLPNGLQAKARELATAIRAAETVKAVNDLVMNANADLEKIKAASAEAFAWLIDLATRREAALAADEAAEAAA